MGLWCEELERMEQLMTMNYPAASCGELTLNEINGLNP